VSPEAQLFNEKFFFLSPRGTSGERSKRGEIAEWKSRTGFTERQNFSTSASPRATCQNGVGRTELTEFRKFQTNL
jgi:hypothetical protein